MSITHILIYLSTYTTFIPIIFGIFRYKQLSIIQRILFWMIVLISINQTISELLMHGFGLKNNLPLYRIYILIEFVFLSFVFIRILKKKWVNLFIRISTSGFIGLWIFSFTFTDNLWTYPSYILFIEGCLILFLSAIYFIQTFKEGKIQNILAQMEFWIASGLTLYFASNILLFLFSEFVVSLSDPSFFLIWAVHAFLTILLYIAYTIAIQCKTNHNLS